jgi:hypothetical protein
VIALALVLGAGIAQWHWGERIAAGRGQGWDGRFYAEMARDFPSQVFGHRLDAYRLERVLPSGIVYLSLRVFDLPPDDVNIVKMFAFYDLALLCGVVLAWVGIARCCAISVRGRWLGFVLLFVCFANLKVPFYYPVLTDTTAFFLGALLVYFHLGRNKAAMLAVLAFGAFSWPSFVGLGALLFVFEPTPLGSEDGPRRAYGAVAALAVIAYLAMLPGNPHLDLQPDRSAAVDKRLLPLSIAIVIAYVAAVAAGLFRSRALFALETYKGAFRPRRAALVVALALLVRLTVHVLSNGARISDVGIYVRNLPARPLIKPGLFLVAHAVYFGVLVPLLIVAWPAACRRAHRLGLGFTLFTAAILAVALTPESRQILHGLPALALIAVLAVEDIRWPDWGRVLVALMAIASTKVWFSLNQGGFLGKSDPFSYPSQFYFMNQGPWMAYENYFLQGGLAVSATLAFVLIQRRARPAGPAQAPLRPPRALLQAAVIFVAALIVVTAVEMASRRILVRALRASPQGDGTGAHRVLGWVNLPLTETRVVTEGREVTVRFNAAGLRGPDRAEAAAPGTRRVLLLGDGFTEGYSVPEDHTARALLETALSGPECHLEVINGGVAGYSTDQEYLFYVSMGRRFRPDLVVLLLYSDDLAHNLQGPPGKPYVEFDDGVHVRLPATMERPRLRSHELEYVDRTPRHHSALLRLLSNRLLSGPPAVQRGALGLGLAERTRPPFEIWPYAAAPETRQMWRQERALLEALQSAVTADGGRLAILYVPARWEVEPEGWTVLLARYRMSPIFWTPDRVARRVRTVAEELGIPLVDPRESLRREESLGRRTYFAREGFWTEAGQAAAAAELATLVRGQDLCGAATH